MSSQKIFVKKSLSQNFLKNKAKQVLVAKTMQVLVVKFPDLPIVEIGPGQGDLTQHFLTWNKKIIALELDLDCVEFLEKKFVSDPKLELKQIDALKVFENPQDFDFLPKDFILLSNLPFHVGSRILMDLPIFYPNLNFSVILQKEVTQKTDLSKNFTFFGAWLNLFWETKINLDLPPKCFVPEPNVTSSLISTKSSNLPKFFDELNKVCTKQFQKSLEKNSDLKNKTQSILDKDNFDNNLNYKNSSENILFAKLKKQFLENSNFREKTRKILKALFANPRKTLANNLKNLSWDKSFIQEFFIFAQIENNTRLESSNYLFLLAQILFFLEKNYKNS